MTTFQFYKKQNALVHVNVDKPAFNHEKQQLIAQGFESVGGRVKAKTSYDAFNRFKAHYVDSVKHFTRTHYFISTPQV
ncbi:hypothetical protein CW745_14410 [Psychromonas sp. psych-6C06]|uniref:hypothetical protein n=1 Tax=Psychromonas sp. psych-6C06 TaxID=2058089 RepID=UPI000C346DA5|nr:hypothetical protein [Psychromonas sp. psych-6C06]PKF60529.1 hypothetical protein CW745_14410 [Psychromonas sp. psych-6C06]